MRARTVKGSVFAILVDGKRIIVKHVFCKGKRCRVFAPPGVTIEEQPNQSATDDTDDGIDFANR